MVQITVKRRNNEPFFKVNTGLGNLWYDFGVGKGGNIIASKEILTSDSLPYLLKPG